MPNQSRINQLRDQRSQITDDLVRNLRSCLPSDWTAAVLEVEVDYSPMTRRRAVKHTLVNPSTGNTVSDFPNSLFESVTALHVISTELNELWIRAIVTLPEPKPGARVYEISYVYGPG